MAKDARMPALNICRETLSPKPADDKLLTAKKSDSYRSRISTQNRGNSTLAMELYYEALKLDPIDVTATNNLAILLAKSGQLPAAENLWQKTFDLNQDIDELGINLALAESMLRNKNAAQRVLQRVLLYSRDQQNRSTKTSGDPIRPRNLRGSCFGILILDGLSNSIQR